MKHVPLKNWRAECPKCHHIEVSQTTGAKCLNCDSPAIMTWKSIPPVEGGFESIEARHSWRRLECSQKCGWVVYSLICSQCGTEIKGPFFKGEESIVMHGCFVATSAYNGTHHPVITELRHLRDNFIVKKRIGRNFINFYYSNGEKWAKILDHHHYLKPLVRVVLSSFVLIQMKAQRFYSILLNKKYSSDKK